MWLFETRSDRQAYRVEGNDPSFGCIGAERGSAKGLHCRAFLVD